MRDVIKSLQKDDNFQVSLWLTNYKNHMINNGMDVYSCNYKVANIKQVLSLTEQCDIRKIRGREALAIATLLPKVPANFHKKREFNGFDAVQAISVNKGLNEPVLAKATVRGKIQDTSSFFKYLTQLEVTDINPFQGLKVRGQGKEHDRFPLTDEQLSSWFNLKWYKIGKSRSPYYYWVPLLLRYTGARLNEICQLLTVDVFERKGIWFIKIRCISEGQVLKTTNAERLIPVSNELIRLGFIEFVQSSKGCLFPELPLVRGRKSPNATKWSSYWRKKLGLGRGYDLHSLRHNFIDELKNSGVPEEVAAKVVGHNHHAFTYSTYGHQYTVETLLDCINKIDTSFTQHVTPYKN